MPGIPLPSIPTIPAVPSYWRFPAELASVPRARRVVGEALPRPADPQVSYELRLLTSELVTNAVRHGARSNDEEMIELVFWTADGHYWLAVSDPGSGRPAVGSPDSEACGGRGLLLVEALSDVWGVVPRPTCGKSVVAGKRLP